MVVSSLDEICWLFNLRGTDVDFNPVFLAYALVTIDGAVLYTGLSKVTQEVREALGSAVQVKEYDEIFTDLRTLSAARAASKEVFHTGKLTL
jgi:Xaa-Pro aminopeptidase